MGRKPSQDQLPNPMNDIRLPVTLTLNKIIKNKAIEVKDIFYDYNKSDIRPDAAIRLDTLVQTLVDNPKISIELSSHTDQRGKDAYNLKLSQQRAESAVDYIVSKGIDKTRITAKGYGETRPIVAEAKTEEEYQRNRRTEFKVTRIAQVARRLRFQKAPTTQVARAFLRFSSSLEIAYCWCRPVTSPRPSPKERSHEVRARQSGSPLPRRGPG